MDDIAAKKLHDDPRAQAATPWGLLILLMAVTAIGPTSLNILVPAVPQLSRDLGADIATLQLTVSLFLIGLGGAQLVMGPLSDRFGRRPVLLAGLALTALSSLAAIAMASATNLILARIVQAIGASAGIVVSRAIIRDLFDRNRAAATIGLVATVMVVVPTFGPLIGGVLDTAYGWKSIFVFSAATSLMVLAWAAMTLPETRNFNAPAATQAGFWADLGHLAENRSFWGYVLVASLGSATFFAFLGGGPHVIVTLMGRTSAEYGIWFAIFSIGFMAGNFGASRLGPPRHRAADPVGHRDRGRRRPDCDRSGRHRAALGPSDCVHAADDRVARQRPPPARRDRGRGQHPPTGRRHRGRHHGLCPDGDRRRRDAILRHAAGGRELGLADSACDGCFGLGADAGILAAQIAGLTARTFRLSASIWNVAFAVALKERIAIALLTEIGERLGSTESRRHKRGLLRRTHRSGSAIRHP